MPDDGNAESQNETLIGRLPREAFARMDAETAEFLALFLPKVEREGNQGQVRDAELVRELVVHHYELVARECLEVARSSDEFALALRGEIALFTQSAVSRYPWLADPLREELEQAFTFLMLCSNPWTAASAAERETVWHVGAMAGEGLAHAALRWRAKAQRRAADGGFPEAKSPAQPQTGLPPGGSQPVGEADHGTAQSGIAQNTSQELPERAAWLDAQLRLRGWTTSDPYRFHGPDRKTVIKVLHGERVRNDTLLKLAEALSKKHSKVSVLDIPEQ